MNYNYYYFQILRNYNSLYHSIRHVQQKHLKPRQIHNSPSLIPPFPDSRTCPTSALFPELALISLAKQRHRRGSSAVFTVAADCSGEIRRSLSLYLYGTVYRNTGAEVVPRCEKRPRRRSSPWLSISSCLPYGVARATLAVRNPVGQHGSTQPTGAQAKTQSGKTRRQKHQRLLQTASSNSTNSFSPFNTFFLAFLHSFSQIFSQDMIWIGKMS